MKKLILLFTFVLFVSGMFAQSIKGKIQDKQNQSIPGVSVFLKETKQGTVTDASGNYEISGVAQGNYNLVVSYTGYTSVEKAVSINGDQIIDLQLAEADYMLEEIAIKGLRADEDAPVAQTNVSEKEINKIFVGQDAQFVLTKVSPSIVTNSESGTGFSNYGSMTLRGMDQKRINITLNGAPLNDMLDQGVYFSNFTDFANSVQSIQIQRGVGTSTNGTSSYAGSINFESVNLQQDKPSVELQTSAGSYNTYRGSIELKSGLMDNNFAFYGRFTNFTSDGYRDHSGTKSWSGFISGGYFGKKDLVKFTAFSGKTQSELAYFSVPKPIIDQNPRTNLNYAQDQDNFGQSFAQLQYTRLFNTTTSLTTSAYFGGASGDFPYGYEDNGAFNQINYPLENRHYGVMSNINISKEKWEFNGGVHAYTFLRRNWETFLPDNVNSLYDDRTQKDEFSSFAKMSYHLGKLSIYGDVQVRIVKMSFTPDDRFVSAGADIPTYNWTFLNPKIGFNYQLNNTYSAYVSYGRTGREPTKTDIFGGSLRLTDDILPFIQNKDLFKPEFVNDFEGGFRVKKDNLTAQFNLFYMQFENEIAAIGELDPLSFFQIRKNIPRSYRRGVEFEWNWQPFESFYFTGNTTFMQANIEEYAPDNDGSNEVYKNVKPVLTPQLMLNGTVGYKLKNKLDISLNGRFIDEMYVELTNQDNLTVPDSFVMNGQINWNFHQQHNLSFMVNNLLDTQYFTYGEVGEYEGQAVPAYFAQATRNFMVMLNLKF